MQKLQIFSISFLFVSTLVSCATPKKADQERAKAYVDQMKTLEKQVTDLREQNAMLKTQADKTVLAKLPDTSSKEVQNEVNGEHSLYTAVLESYWAKDLAKVQRWSNMLIKTYPQSVHADNALLLEARLLYANNKPAEALQTLNRLVRVYSGSDKAVTAELLKAEIFEKLNLTEQSREILARIKKQYPGSPEARSAQARMNSSKGISR